MDIEKLHYIETKYDLFNKEINGFPYWIYCRAEIECIYINSRLYGAGYHAKRQFNIKNFIEDVTAIVFNTISRGYIKHKEEKIVFLNHERRVWNGNSYECIYTDDLVSYYNALAIERTYLHRHLKPIPTQRILYTDKMEVISNLWAVYNSKIKNQKFRKLFRQLKGELEPVFQEIERLENIQLDKDEIYVFILAKYYMYQSKKKYFERLVQIIRPKVVVEVVSYNMDCMIMNELAYKYQYKTIELQHGTIGKNHVAYNYPPKIDKVEQLPQVIMAFSKFFFKHNYLPNVKIFEVGFPYLEKMKKKYPPKRHGIKTILFISQPTTGKLLSEVAVKLHKYVCIKKIPLRIIYRLHPGDLPDWEKRYSALKNSNIETVDTRTSIYEQFSACDYQIGTSSTALFEGLAYHLKTLVLNSFELNYLKDLCDKGYAKLVNNYIDVANALVNENDFKQINFWGDNSLERIKKYLNSCEGIDGA